MWVLEGAAAGGSSNTGKRRECFVPLVAIVFLAWVSVGVMVVSRFEGVVHFDSVSGQTKAGPPSDAQLRRESLHRLELASLSHSAFAARDDTNVQHPNVPPPLAFNTCPMDPVGSLHYSVTGERCIFPFFYKGRWHEDGSEGICATQVSLTGSAKTIARCDTQQKVTADTRCLRVQGASTCAGEAVTQESTCYTPVENATCVCSGRLGIVSLRVGATSCGRHTTCEEECRGAVEDVMSTSFSSTLDEAGPELLRYVALLADKHAPKNDTHKWKDFAAALPDHESVKHIWCGRGIAIMAGRVSTMPQALATVAFLRGHLKSNLPVEIWQDASEQTDTSEAFQRGLRQHSIVIRTLPKQANSNSSGDMFSLKPAVLLASSFDEVLFLDSDALPLVDPKRIFDERAPNSTAVYWPDYWTLLWDAKIWDTMGGWPFGEQRHVASQESGLMVVCKSCGAWKALATSFFLNYHASTFYPAIYVGHYDEEYCGTDKCKRDGKNWHIMPGMGDKDTFHISHMMMNITYKMMAPSVLGGPMLPKGNLVCGTSIMHRGSDNNLIALHHNSNKWDWKSFAAKQWVPSLFFPTHLMAFKNDSSAYHADGQNEWESITYNWREDAGAQKTPAGSRWCIIYKGETVISTVKESLGYSLEVVLNKYYTAQYSTPWLIDWIDSMEGDNFMEKNKGWEADKLYFLCAVSILVYLLFERLYSTFMHSKDYSVPSFLQFSTSPSLPL